jgi:hypothetical protein
MEKTGVGLETSMAEADDTGRNADGGQGAVRLFPGGGEVKDRNNESEPMRRNQTAREGSIDG